MSRQLADVNVLFALAWPAHEHHEPALAWFRRHATRGWATNPITQLGLLRLLTNPRATNSVTSATGALEILRKAVANETHEFWDLDAAALAELRRLAKRITGHRQWTDALLLSHAIARDGVLVTFDRAIAGLAGEHRARVTILE